eukprot:760229-Rhodomonas_salina.2
MLTLAGVVPEQTLRGEYYDCQKDGCGCGPASDRVTRASDRVTRASDRVTRASGRVTRASGRVTRASGRVTRAPCRGCAMMSATETGHVPGGLWYLGHVLGGLWY